MISHQVDLLAPFGTTSEERWFRTAYKWKRDEIYDWMNRMAQARGAKLKTIYARIRSLSLLNGDLYKRPDLRPSSHIARRVNRGFPGDGTSKFFVDGWTIRPSIDPSMQGREPGWWCPYDLLGLFLSLLGPAPDGADRINFYLPLTAVYARWCSRIAGRPFPNWGWEIPDQEKGQGDFPAVFQCTWHTTVNEETKQRSGHYFLGASTAGDRFNKAYTGSWRERVQEARFTMLFNCQNVTMVQQDDFKKKTAPNQNHGNPNRNMVPWANCAETYPFATRFFREKKKNELMEGLALKRDFMKEGECPEYNSSTTSEMWGQVIAPCANCRALIQRAGGIVANFT